MSRNLHLTLAFMLALLSFVSCSAPANTDSETQAEPTENGETAPADTTSGFADRLNIDDGIGSYDFSGAVFNIVLSTEQMSDPYFTDAENGEVINDAVYRRTINIEERFNVSFEHHDTGGDWNEVSEAVRISVLAGDKAYDLAAAHTYIGLTGLMSNGSLYDWNKLPVVDMTKPWWNSSAKEKLQIGDLLLTACSDYIYQRPMVIFFNKQMIADSNLENPYELVKSGAWTWDKLTSHARAVTSDLNGDGVFDESDQYGYSHTVGWQSVTVVHSMGLSLTEFDENGYPRFAPLASEKMQTVVEKFYDLLYNGDQTLHVPWEPWMGAKAGITPLFGQGQVLYLHSNTEILPDMRDITIEFGLLPLPKFDEAQNSYYVMSDTQVLIIPVSIDSPEMVGVISEALAVESYKHVVPAVYEVTYENKRLRDSESYEMFNIIRSGLVYEFSWTYGEGGQMVYILPTLMSQKSTNLASFYAQNVKAAEKQLERVIDKVLEHYS